MILPASMYHRNILSQPLNIHLHRSWCPIEIPLLVPIPNPNHILWSQITKQASLLLICWMLEAFRSFSRWVARHWM